MKIVLAMMPVWKGQTPPLSLAYLKASVVRAGIECRAMDIACEYTPMMISVQGDLQAERHIREHPTLIDDWAERICAEGAQVVGFSILASNIRPTALVAAAIKRRDPDVVIVSGGYCFTRHSMGTIEHGLAFSDYVVEGEGEATLVALLEALDKGEDPSASVPQVWTTEGDGTPSFSGSGSMPDIDAIALPDFSDFDRSSYRYPDRMPVLFSRGCILNCTFCTNKWNHRTQRTRQGKLVFEELLRNVHEHGMKEFIFNDDSLISHITFREINTFCDLLIEADLGLRWDIYGTRIDKLLLDEDFVAKLARAGLRQAQLGVESFSTRVQKDMAKSSNYESSHRIVRSFAEHGIRPLLFIIYGYPTETDEEFQETAQWLRDNPDIVGHVTANAFIPNEKYAHDRPGTFVRYAPHAPWSWVGKEATLEKRKARFLELVDVLERERRNSTRGFDYSIADPLAVKFVESWGPEERAFLEERWAELTAGVREPAFVEDQEAQRAIRRQADAVESARILRAQGRYSGALEAYDQALHNPTNPSPLVFAERAALRQVEGDEAGWLRDILRASLYSPADAMLPRIAQAITAVENGEPSIVKSLTRLDPSHPATHALLHLARALSRRQSGDWAGAIEDFERAASVAPPDGQAMHELLEVLRQPEIEPLSYLDRVEQVAIA